MRHGASLVAAMEGISRPAFRIARELAQNSRSGLTVRFLAKKLEIPAEEVEYLVDLHHRLLFIDITKVKLAAEGHSAVKRIVQGLENRGDVPSLFRLVKALSAHEFRRLEEQIGVEKPGTKKAAAQHLLERFYTTPEAIVSYVATRGYSPKARELFDIVWQSKDGVMPVSKIRATYGGSDYDVEQALWELFRGCSLFEMFRFDAEDRLVRVAGLLSEIRQWRDANAGARRRRHALKRARGAPVDIDERELDLSDRACRLVAAIAAKPARLRNDGELFREDRARLEPLGPEGVEPSLNTLLWMAEGVGWLARVDNELRAGELEDLIELSRLQRHRILFDWLTARTNEAMARRSLIEMLDEMKPGTWYPTMDAVRHAVVSGQDGEQPVLQPASGRWHYVNPSAAAGSEKALTRALEETFLWLGIVARGGIDGAGVFRVTPLGRALLTGKALDKLDTSYPQRKAEVVVQPNFDVVVPSQDMDPLLTVPLDQFALRASTGHATVYTVTKDSFTQAIQEGHDADAFLDFLLVHNRRGTLPTNVMTTLDDWRGGIKRVRLRTIHVLETDDPLVLADLMHRRRFKKCLTPLDRQRVVAYRDVSKSDLARELEKDGFVVD